MDTTLFSETFLGEYIEVIYNLKTVKGGFEPVALYGFLLDVDEDYYFMGDDALAITIAIPKAHNPLIRIVAAKTQEETLLDDMDLPDPDRQN